MYIPVYGDIPQVWWLGSDREAGGRQSVPVRQHSLFFSEQGALSRPGSLSPPSPAHPRAPLARSPSPLCLLFRQGWNLIIGFLVVACIFEIAFGLSWGPLSWLVPVEIQPQETRSVGYAVAVAFNFGACFAARGKATACRRSRCAALASDPLSCSPLLPCRLCLPDCGALPDHAVLHDLRPLHVLRRLQLVSFGPRAGTWPAAAGRTRAGRRINRPLSPTSLSCRFNTILLLFFLPETKGVPLEELGRLFGVGCGCVWQE